jgi:hypothetical protein
MQAIDEGDAGYPEEQPPGAQPGDAASGSDVREGAEADEAAERAPDNDDGTATGNPHTT